MATPRICSIEGCGKPVQGRGWCSLHYQRWRFHGDPLRCRHTPKGDLERYYRDVVLTHDGDECLVWPYGTQPNGYAVWDKQCVSRMVCEEENGPPPTPEHDAAHSCGNRP